MNIQRTTKEKRAEDAVRLMQSNTGTIALVVDRQLGSTLTRTRLLANVYNTPAYPAVVAESASNGQMGAFYEFLKAINPTCLPDSNIAYNNGALNTHLEKHYHFRIVYDDGFVMILQRC